MTEIDLLVFLILVANAIVVCGILYLEKRQGSPIAMANPPGHAAAGLEHEEAATRSG